MVRDSDKDVPSDAFEAWLADNPSSSDVRAKLETMLRLLYALSTVDQKWLHHRLSNKAGPAMARYSTVPMQDPIGIGLQIHALKSHNKPIGGSAHIDLLGHVHYDLPAGSGISDLAAAVAELHRSGGTMPRFAGGGPAYGLDNSTQESPAAPVGAADDPDRLAFLADALGDTTEHLTPFEAREVKVQAAALDILGGESVLGRAIRNEEELVEALAAGLPGDAITQLRSAGYSYAILDRLVAPRRTLMRRKADNQRLTRAESDAAWRLAHALALASHVLGGRKAAHEWLARAKAGLSGRTPLDLLETSVGTAYIERILRNLDWGDVA